MQVGEFLKQWMLSKVSEECNVHHLILLWSLFQDILRMKKYMEQNFCHHTPEEQVAGWLIREWGSSFTSMFYCEVDVLKERHFCSKFAADLVTVPQKCTGCNNKHLETSLRQSIILEQYRHFKKWLHLWPKFKMMLITLTRRVWYIMNYFNKATHWIRFLMEQSLQCLQHIVRKLLPVPRFCTLTMYCAQWLCMLGRSCQAS